VDTTETKAYDEGREAGLAAGSWLVTEDNARAVLDALLECDLDMPSPLSGEWAGESIPELSADYGVDLSDPWIADAFECGYFDGFAEVVENDARAYLEQKVG